MTPPQRRTGQRLLTLVEAAEIVGLSVDTIRRAIKSTGGVDAKGAPIFPPPLPAKLVAGRYRIRESALDGWIDSLPDA